MRLPSKDQPSGSTSRILSFVCLPRLSYQAKGSSAPSSEPTRLANSKGGNGASAMRPAPKPRRQPVVCRREPPCPHLLELPQLPLLRQHLLVELLDSPDQRAALVRHWVSRGKLADTARELLALGFKARQQGGGGGICLSELLARETRVRPPQLGVRLLQLLARQLAVHCTSRSRRNAVISPSSRSCRGKPTLRSIDVSRTRYSSNRSGMTWPYSPARASSR